MRDDPAVYAVEQNRALQATVITYDGTYTFADVNADIDDTDAVEPEIDAHFVMDGYPDDGLQINATLRLRGSSTRLAEQKSYRDQACERGGRLAWRKNPAVQQASL